MCSGKKTKQKTKHQKAEVPTVCNLHKKGLRTRQVSINGNPGPFWAGSVGHTEQNGAEGLTPELSPRGPAAFPTPGDNTFSSSEPLRPQLTGLFSDALTRSPNEAASLTANHRPRKSPPRPHQKVLSLASPLNASSLTELARVRS